MFSFIFFVLFFCFNFCSFYLLFLCNLFSLSLYINVVFYILFFFVSLILSWILILFFLFLLMIFCKKLRVDHPFRQKFVISSISKLIIRFFRIKIYVYNKELIPLQGQLIIYSNHKTNFDPFIIASIFPRTVSFTPKHELYYGKIGWFLSYLFNASNCIQIQRDNKRKTIENILKGVENIKNNLAIVIFHEGGIIYKNSDKIFNSLDGSFQIAFKSHSNILPITLKGTCDMRGKCWFRRKKVEVFIHKSLKFQEFSKNNTKEINQKVTSIINSVL